MQDDIQRQILDAFFVILRPIAKILLRCGIGFREFAEVSKAAFVDVASSEYGLRGRPTNISRVAVMSGLTRKEVRRIRNKIESGEHAVAVKSTPLCETTRVMCVSTGVLQNTSTSQTTHNPQQNALFDYV